MSSPKIAMGRALFYLLSIRIHGNKLQGFCGAFPVQARFSFSGLIYSQEMRREPPHPC
ncbi:hypothetical protein TevJSym_be00320 [endosymbiont of Tevnia jerichonana (vent Tica)]|uniref:Uncharacterized protein n=1 Tax=endosymbiont of Tevnia jerichonana (vent Tica) TaxID=1049564 RepID=G2FIP2_9GAMM|nr:hypothetical protein TevJSym_be00320 [endosymbiont of Tevnia jerichonana (vent Tica)]